jgi:dihydrofolate synthase / folylpolyglutamate synthase
LFFLGMTYQETLSYLYQQLPMFQRIGNAAFKKSLANIYSLCHALGNPHSQFKSVHIAGTNGKGSSSNMLAAVMQAAGYKTGLYTSPHLKSFTERIKINGLDVPEEYVVQFVAEHKQLIESIEPSFFEMTVAMAFQYFADQRVDIAIVEVGLGGRLDSTNIINPLVSLITSIGLDHQALLGNDLVSIAGEKAGIIKPGIPAVISHTQAEITEVFRQKALAEGSPISFADQEYRVEQLSTGHFNQLVNVYQQEQLYLANLTMDLPGHYQRFNLPGVLKVCELLNETCFSLSEQQIRNGLGQVRVLTQFKGRWQVLKSKPLTICDTGHNVDGVKLVIDQLRQLQAQRLRIVWGMVNDKDISPILQLLPTDARYYFCQPAIPRGLAVIELVEKAKAFGLIGDAFASVEEACKAAQKEASAEDVVFIGGSTFVVAEIAEL